MSEGLFLSAPGKIILFGEHAVVYGRTAVAGSIDLRTYISLYTSADGRIYLSLPDLNVERTWLQKDLFKAAERLGESNVSDDQPPSLDIVLPYARKLSGSCEEQCGVQHLAILAFWYLLLGIAQRKRDLLAVKVTIRFKLPSCVGLGSSGAFCVCTAASLLITAGLIPKPVKRIDIEGLYTWEEEHLETIRKWSAAAETLIHGRASGFDAAVCTYGGVASFRPGSKIQQLKNLPELKVILVNSRVERNTSRMVSVVKEKLKKYPDVVEGIFNSIDAISKESIKVFNRTATASSSSSNCNNSSEGSSRAGSTSDATQAAGAVAALSMTNNVCNDVCNDRHSLQDDTLDAFVQLNVDQICTTMARYGIHPKMTGAGGGGSIFAFLKPDTSQTIIDMITKEMTTMGFELWRPNLGGFGVVMHSDRPPIFTPKP